MGPNSGIGGPGACRGRGGGGSLLPRVLPPWLSACGADTLDGFLRRSGRPMLLDQIRAMAEAMPPGGAVLLSREWLLAELEGAGSHEAQPLAVDLTVPDLVRLLGKTPSTIRSWLRDGLFPGAYLLHGKQWRVPRSAVEAFQTHAREQGGHPPAAAPQGKGNLGDYRKVRRPV
jgi:hypothetical protein